MFMSNDIIYVYVNRIFFHINTIYDIHIIKQNSAKDTGTAKFD